MSDFNIVEVDNPELKSGDKGTSTGASITSNPVDANTEALHVDGSKVTQPVSAASLPLPAGAATEATSLDIETELQTLNAKDFATETKLEAVRALLATIDADTSLIEANLDVLLSTRASESTLSAVDTKLATIDAVLDSIKDVDGIKKITDQLPAGTNEIGLVGQGTPGGISDPWPVILSSGVGEVQTDSFNRLYTASPESLIDYYSKYGLLSIELESDTANGGTVTDDTGKSAIEVGVTGTSGSEARVVTKTFFRYQAGRGQDIVLSLYHSDTGQANQVRRWGYYTPDASNPEGLFFQLSGTTLQVVRHSNVSGVASETIDRSNWNVDVMDGTGPSGINLDITKANIYEIDFQWLGVGLVNFKINGFTVHQMNNRNAFTGPYMRSGSHPVTYEVVNTGASTAGSMTFMCISVTSQGGQDAPTFTYAAQNESGISVSTTEKAILAIRPKSTLNSVPFRGIALPDSIEIEHTSGQLRWRILAFNSLSMTGGTWTSASSQSGFEYNTTMTGFTGGALITGGFIATAPGAERIDLSRYFSRLGEKLRNPLYAGADQLALVAVKDSGGNTDVRATLTWGEIL